MDTDQDMPKQPKKRGRPLGSKKKPRNIQGDAPQNVLFDDEQLAYTLAEEKLSPFSSLLRHILRHDRAEIARIARDLEVADITIYRWMNGSSEPRAMHLKRLPEVLGENRGNLIYAINQTFPGVLSPPLLGIREVRKDIYRHVLDLITATPEEDARYWQVTQAIFEYALLHLDSDRRGLAITYANLMPAHDDGIHSLREATMRGNYPWPFNLESRAYLGSTTLAGTAAMLQRLQTWDNLGNEERLQVDIDEFERSAVACPVMYAGRTSGVLIVSSTQTGFFVDPMACQAVIEYAQLLALALHDGAFYPCSLLNLRPMPDVKWQRAEIGRSYVNRIITYARKHLITRHEAEQHILNEMEREFEELGQRLSDQQKTEPLYKNQDIL
ncbi:MAG: hypothetical protein NVS4B11_36830 [Ktedonobacteraceae bacterium]